MVKRVAKGIYKCKYLYIMLIPVFAYYIIFHYWPMYGAQISFRDFNAFQGVWGSPWVGFKHFRMFFQSPYFYRLIRNTLSINIQNLIYGFPAPIILALMLNEVHFKKFSRTVQTIVYLPHFISTVVVCGMIMSFLSLRTGIINVIIRALGGEAIHFLAEPGWFQPVFVISGIWQGVGWGSIIYLAALSGIDPTLYEAAIVDGASRWKRMLHITIPCLMPTIIIMLILRMGSMLNIGYEKIILLYNEAIYETADVISTYVYRRGILGADYSFSTAVGLFNSICNFILVIVFNKISSSVSETSLW